MDEQDRLLHVLEERNVESAELGGSDRALLRYVERLTVEPWTIAAKDVDALRAAGFDDRAIHDACSVAAYYSFVNRLADGLGVELESESA